MRLTIASKLSLISALFIAVTAASLTAAFYFGSSLSLLTTSLKHYSALANQEGQRINTLIAEGVSDLHLLANQKEMQDYVDTLADGSRLKAVENEFRHLLIHGRHYRQVRFIDLSGTERIRLARSDGNIRVIDKEHLTDHSHHADLNAVQHLNTGHIYLSGINLEEGPDPRHSPIIALRVATPIADSAHHKAGIIVIDLDLGPHLNKVRTALGELSRYAYITNAEGLILSLQGDENTPGDEVAPSRNLKELLPEIAPFYQSLQASQFVMLPGENRRSLASAFQKLPYDPGDPRRFLVIGFAAPEGLILHSEEQLLLRNISWAVLLTIAGIFIAWMFSLRLVRPLNTLTAAAQTFITRRETPPFTPGGSYEIAQLGYVFKKLTEEVVRNERRLQTLNATLEQRIEERNRELLASQKMLETVLDALPNRIFWKDREGTYLGGNRHFAADAGLDSPQALVGLSDHELPWKIYAPEYRQHEQLVLESGRSQLNVIEQAILADGTTRWLETNKLPLPGSDGSIIGILGSYQDITDRYNAESELRHSEERLSKSQQIAHVGTWDWDITEDKLHWSEGIYTIFGVNHQDFAVSYPAFIELVHPRDIDRVTAAVDYSLRHPEANYSIDHRIVRPNGEVRYVEEQGEVYRSEAGEPVRMLGVTHDITEHTLAQLALHREKERTERYLQVTEAIIVELNKDGRILRINQRGCNLLGYQMKELLGRNWFDNLSLPAKREEYKSAFANLMQQCQGDEGAIPPHIDHEEDLLCRDGKQVTLIWHTTTNFDERGHPCGTLCAGQDITQRKQIEQLKDEFVSTVSHELRTPLTSIHGSLRLILGHVFGEIPPKVLELLKVASSNSERLLVMVNDLLDIQKIEAGMMPFHFTPLSPYTLLEEAIRNNKPFAAGHSVGLRLHSDAHPQQVSILADQGRLLQVMNNLLSNAIKYAPSGDEVEVVLQGTPQQIVIEVNDRGPGVPESYREQLFDKFTQVDSSDSRQKGGSGLGLNIARLIVEKHGGTLTYHDNPGGGSRFRITLPAEPPQTPANEASGDVPISGTLPAIEN